MISQSLVMGNKPFFRCFGSAAQIVSNTAKLTSQFTQQSLDLYKKNKVDVDKELDKVCENVSIICIVSSTLMPIR